MEAGTEAQAEVAGFVAVASVVAATVPAVAKRQAEVCPAPGSAEVCPEPGPRGSKST